MAGAAQLGGVFAKAGAGLLSVSIEVPAWPRDVSKVLHNRFAKEALRRTLVRHHDVTLREHFTAEAHSKYGYAERSARYNAKKQRYGQPIDLVKSGRSKNRILGPDYEIVLGGAAVEGKKDLEGKLIVRFAFSEELRYERKPRKSQRYTAAKRNITIQQMAKEVQAWTDQERREAAQYFVEQYMEQLNQFKAGRKRIRYRY